MDASRRASVRFPRCKECGDFVVRDGKGKCKLNPVPRRGITPGCKDVTGTLLAGLTCENPV